MPMFIKGGRWTDSDVACSIHLSRGVPARGVIIYLIQNLKNNMIEVLEVVSVLRALSTSCRLWSRILRQDFVGFKQRRKWHELLKSSSDFWYSVDFLGVSIQEILAPYPHASTPPLFRFIENSWTDNGHRGSPSCLPRRRGTFTRVASSFSASNYYLVLCPLLWMKTAIAGREQGKLVSHYYFRLVFGTSSQHIRCQGCVSRAISLSYVYPRNSYNRCSQFNVFWCAWMGNRDTGKSSREGNGFECLLETFLGNQNKTTMKRQSGQIIRWI